VPFISIIHTHSHTHPFNDPLSGTTRVSRYQKEKPIWVLLKQETVSGSGISWAICKSAPRSRQITTPEPHHSVLAGRMPFLPPNQQHQSTESNSIISIMQLPPYLADCRTNVVLLRRWALALCGSYKVHGIPLDSSQVMARGRLRPVGNLCNF